MGTYLSSRAASTCVLVHGRGSGGGAELLRRIKALAELAYPWQCGGGVEIAGLARSGCFAMGERRTPTGGGSRVATGQRPNKATNRPLTMLVSSSGDAFLIAPASKALQTGGTAGLAGLQCATHCRLYDRVLSDTVPSTVHVGSPARSLAVTLRCGSCVVMRQQGIAAAVWACGGTRQCSQTRVPTRPRCSGCCEVMPSGAMDWTKPINRSTDQSQSVPILRRVEHAQ